MTRANPTGNAVEDRRARELQTDLRRVLALPFADGIEVTVAATGAGTVTVAHRLGRAPRGWMPIRKVSSGVAVIDLQEITSTSNDKTITFRVTTTGTVTLWVW